MGLGFDNKMSQDEWQALGVAIRADMHREFRNRQRHARPDIDGSTRAALGHEDGENEKL